MHVVHCSRNRPHRKEGRKEGRTMGADRAFKTVVRMPPAALYCTGRINWSVQGKQGGLGLDVWAARGLQDGRQVGYV
jgi:hypothetical protein